MSDSLQSSLGGSEDKDEELGRVVEDFKEFSANLFDILLPLHSGDCSCGSCPSNDGWSVSFKDLARYFENVVACLGALTMSYQAHGW